MAGVRQKEGLYTAQPVEVADNMATARAGNYADAFGQALLKAMEQ